MNLFGPLGGHCVFVCVCVFFSAASSAALSDTLSRHSFAADTCAPLSIAPSSFFSVVKRTNGDGIHGDGAITQKRFAVAQRWRRSVRGRHWPGK